MVKGTWVVLSALLIAAAPKAQSAPPAPAGEGGSPLFNALGSDDVAEARLQEALSRLPASQRQAFTARLARKKDFRSLLTLPKQTADDGKAETIFGLRQTLERAAFTLTPDRWAAQDAADFASSIPILSDWERFPEGPMADAQAARKHLEQNPGTSVKDFVQLFVLHRFRCAFEAAVQNSPAQRQAAKAYREAWDRVRNSRDLATAAVASDIDTQRFIYISSLEHPRTFKDK